MVDVAIVGMACVMPGAPDLEAFWANIVDGVDSITEVPPSRWDPALHFDPAFDPAAMASASQPKTVSKWGGWLPDVEFDALAWGIPPASLPGIDPVQLLALKVAAAALDDAGYGSGGFDRERASVVFASGSGGATDLPAGYLLRSLLPRHLRDGIPPALDGFLPRLGEDGFPGILTSVIAGRVANRLDLGGKNLTVDAACASALAALDVACTELAARSSDLVLCGAADLHNAVHDFFYFTAAHALSPTGRCRSFDANADGTTLGEGVGCLVLKRLADALASGDRIFAVVRGVGGSSDGRHLGLTAPRPEGQHKALRRAYAAAELSPADVGLVEAHGTGTVAGDSTELQALTTVFTEASARPGSVVLGTVKSNIGHIKCAAGIAALIKAAKALYHGVQPPTLHVTRPNHVWDPATSPFVFLDRVREWRAQQRVAAVSAFGFGGTNFHAVLASHDLTGAHTTRGGSARSSSSGSRRVAVAGARATGPAPPVRRLQWPSELLAFRAPTDAALAACLDELAVRLAAERNRPVRRRERPRLRDVAASVCACGDAPLPVRLVIVADDLDDLAVKVDVARTGRAAVGVYRARAAGPQPSDSGRAAQSSGDPDEPLPGAPDGQASAPDVPPLHGEAITAWLHELAQRTVSGAALDIDVLHRGRDSCAEHWEHPSTPAGWVVNGHLVRTADGTCLPGGLRPASEAPAIDLGSGRPNGVGGEVTVAMEYLRLVQGLVATGTEIVRSQLADPGLVDADEQS
ncbi:MAG: beta-ketoacyl synthase N-terminal-like domain-containing protein [Acidimicrobiales bacterium]